MLSVSPTKERILEHLAEYKYLCVSQFITLGITSSVQVCRRALRELKNEFGFVDRMDVITISQSLGERIERKRVRQEGVFYLTKKGAEFIDEEMRIDMRGIRYPKRKKKSLSNDYFHRISSVSTHISYNNWIQKHDFTHKETLLYYDKRKKFKKLKTTIESRIDLKGGRTKTPDLVMGYENKKGEGKIFVVEVYNGSRKKYLVDETKELIKALQENHELSLRVGVEKFPRILITCEDQEKMKRAMESIKKDPFFNFKKIDQMLFFNVDSEVWKDFGSNWINLSGEVINLENI